MCVPCACHVRAVCVPCACHVRAMCVLCACRVRAVWVRWCDVGGAGYGAGCETEGRAALAAWRTDEEEDEGVEDAAERHRGGACEQQEHEVWRRLQLGEDALVVGQPQVEEFGAEAGSGCRRSRARDRARCASGCARPRDRRGWPTEAKPLNSSASAPRTPSPTAAQRHRGPGRSWWPAPTGQRQSRRA